MKEDLVKMSKQNTDKITDDKKITQELINSENQDNDLFDCFTLEEVIESTMDESHPMSRGWIDNYPR